MLLTVKQAAVKIGVSPGLVYALCAARRIRHERHGLGRGRILIPEEAVEEYRRGQTVESELPTPDRQEQQPPSRARRAFRHLR